MNRPLRILKPEMNAARVIAVPHFGVFKVIGHEKMTKTITVFVTQIIFFISGFLT